MSDITQMAAFQAMDDGRISAKPETISSHDLMRACGHDPLAPFEVGAFPAEMRQKATESAPSEDDLTRLDEAIDFVNAIAGVSLGDLADNLWNLRNRIAPFPYGHRHHPDEDEELSVVEAAQMVIATASDHYTASNGKRMGIEGDDGEKCWIVPFDQFEDLRRAVERASA